MNVVSHLGSSRFQSSSVVAVDAVVQRTDAGADSLVVAVVVTVTRKSKRVGRFHSSFFFLLNFLGARPALDCPPFSSVFMTSR